MARCEFNQAEVSEFLLSFTYTDTEGGNNEYEFTSNDIPIKSADSKAGSSTVKKGSTYTVSKMVKK